MSWIKYILIFIAIYLICSARTCTEDEEAAAKREEQDIIKLIECVETVFTSDTLSDDLLRGYEINAINKLNDFGDYLKIVSDTTLELKFRQHAAELTRNLFIPGEIELNNWSKAYPAPALNTLEFLLEYSLSEGISCWLMPLQINVSTPFILKNDSTFSGALNFKQDCISLNKREISGSVSGKLIIDIYLIKQPKQFGDEKLNVWKVYLGDIGKVPD
jgi:hypothetical protein